MKSALALAALLGTVAATPGFAHADEPAASLSAPARNGKAGNVVVQLDVLPAGHVRIAKDGIGAGATESVDLSTAYGVGIQLNYLARPHFSLGLAPRLVFNVKSDEDSAAAKQLDLRARITLHTGSSLSPVLQLFAFAEPGYSISFIDQKVWPAGLDTPAGPVLALGGGATYDVLPSIFVTGEVGYQLGFQTVTARARDADFGFDYLHVGLGAGARF